LSANRKLGRRWQKSSEAGKIDPVNSLDFEVLKQRIAMRLYEKGPATSETIASELDAPHGNVCFALEQLQSERKKPVKRLPFGFWDVTEETEKVA
jgi:hypothetical protein